MQASFWKAGHPPTLFAAFLYFDVSFMVWVLLGPLGVQIAQTLQISPAEKGLMVATPVLAGAFLRVVLGLMVDRLGPKLTGIIGQIIVMAALAAAWLIGLSAFWQVMLLGVFLGVAGASFAVALPLASRWYPPNIRAQHWASPGPAIPEPCSRRCSPRRWPRGTAGTASSGWR